MNLSSELLSLLRCPLCPPPAPLQIAAGGAELQCLSGAHRFPLTAGFPDLRPEDLKAPAPAALPKLSPQGK